MKIAMTTMDYNRKGGISRYVTELSERFAEKNEVHLYSNTWKDVQNFKVKFHRVYTLPGPTVIRTIPYTLQNSLRFKFFRDGYDIVHTNGADAVYADVITAHSIHKAGIKFKEKIGEVKGLGVHDFFVLQVEKENYTKRNYKKIICVSHSSKNELMKCYGVPEDDIVVIPNGVNPEEFKPLPGETTASLRKKYGFHESDVVLLIVATEFYRKGMVELLHAVDLLVNRRGYKNIKLLIVGRARDEGLRKGDVFYRELAEKLNISKNVIFTGLVEDLNAHYNLADIFVFPTKYEAFGIPTLEAMSAGLPVINSRIGAGELIEDGKSGILLDNPNDVTEIADKIESLLTFENLRRELGANARKTAIKYSWDNIAARTLEVYEEVLWR